MIKIGLLREGKIPPDNRVPFTPAQCAYIMENFPISIYVQPSPIRGFLDDEYASTNTPVVEDLSNCDLLMGIKEVPVHELQAGRTYFFFSHTMKEQESNRELLRAIVRKNIRLIDYEALTDKNGKRLVAFGYFAGIVGAHNALWAFAQRNNSFQIRRMRDYLDYERAKSDYGTICLPPLKVVLTGTGRVGSGAVKVLEDMGLRRVTPQDFLRKKFAEAVYTQLGPEDYVVNRYDGSYDKTEFYTHPDRYRSIFHPYYRVSDILIHGIYWDQRAPAVFDRASMRSPDFRIQVIADITCDIFPNGSIPSTLRPTTIAQPVMGYDPFTEAEAPPFQSHFVDMMTVDNLPSELPRDSSEMFGDQLIEYVLPELLKDDSPMLKRAIIAENGHLMPKFFYLSEFVLHSGGI